MTEQLNMNLRIGCHLSSSKGYEAMAKTALSIGANTFQFFTRNPRGGSVKPFDEEDAHNYAKFASENGIGKILAHAPYTLNACAADKHKRDFALMAMKDDLERLEHIPDVCYNFHPGSHVKQGVDIGIDMIVELINKVLVPEQKTMVLLETMAGKGSEVGRTFEEIARIIEGVEVSEKIGVCMDTCHIFDGGYDIVNDLDGVISEFDKIIGIDRLYAVHLNDSKNVLGSHKDRHEKIGEGNIGLEALGRVINHEKLKDKPFYLETPNEIDGYEREIKMLRRLYKW